MTHFGTKTTFVFSNLEISAHKITYFSVQIFGLRTFCTLTLRVYFLSSYSSCFCEFWKCLITNAFISVKRIRFRTSPWHRDFVLHFSILNLFILSMRWCPLATLYGRGCSLFYKFCMDPGMHIDCAWLTFCFCTNFLCVFFWIVFLIMFLSAGIFVVLD